jgi:hypothetical protein
MARAWPRAFWQKELGYCPVQSTAEVIKCNRLLRYKEAAFLLIRYPLHSHPCPYALDAKQTRWPLVVC